MIIFQLYKEIPAWLHLLKQLLLLDLVQVCLLWKDQILANFCAEQ